MEMEGSRENVWFNLKEREKEMQITWNSNSRCLWLTALERVEGPQQPANHLHMTESCQSRANIGQIVKEVGREF